MSCDGRNSKVNPLPPCPIQIPGLTKDIGAILGFRVISLNIWHVQLLRFGHGIGRELDWVFSQASVLVKEGQRSDYSLGQWWSNRSVSGNFGILKDRKELLFTVFIYITVLEIKLRVFLKHKNIQVHVPLIVRMMISHM